MANATVKCRGGGGVAEARVAKLHLAAPVDGGVGQLSLQPTFTRHGGVG